MDCIDINVFEDGFEPYKVITLAELSCIEQSINICDTFEELFEVIIQQIYLKVSQETFSRSLTKCQNSQIWETNKTLKKIISNI